jgi:quercetin dioxygenase-like cupin family protein
MTRISMIAVAALALFCAGPSNLEPVIAQQGITRTPISTIDFPGGYQIEMGVAQIPANTCFDRHTHPGVESAYALEGEVHLKIEGSPEKDIKAGSGVQIPPGAPHGGCTAAAGAKVLTVHVVEKGKPLASPAP